MIKFSVRSTYDLTPVQPMYKTESPSLNCESFQVRVCLYAHFTHLGGKEILGEHEQAIKINIIKKKEIE